MSKERISSAELVSQYIEKLDQPIGEIVEYLRKAILSTHKEIAEQIKWNSPSFYYSGQIKAFDPKEYKRDIVVMNLHKGRILLVFPTGAKIEHEVLEGNYTDGRRLINIEDMEDAKAKASSIQAIIKKWLQLVEK